MSVTKASADKILKEFYGPAIETQLSEASVLQKHFEKKKVSFSGRRWLQPIETARNESVGFVADGESLPGAHSSETIGNTTYGEWIVHEKYLYGTIEFTGPSQNASRDRQGAFVSVKAAEMEGLVRGLKQRMNHALNGAGWGALAKVQTVATTSATSDTLTLVARTAHGLGGARFIKAGQYIQMATTEIAAAAVNSGTPRKISSITDASPDATIILLDGAANAGTGVAQGHFIFRNREAYDGTTLRGAADATPLGSEGSNTVEGIAAAIDDGTLRRYFQGVDRGAAAGAHICDAKVLGNSGTARALTKTLMQMAVDLPDEDEGDGGINLIHCHHSARRAYVDLLNDDIRYVAEEARGGFANAKLSYNGGPRPIPFQTDRAARYGVMYFMDTSSFKMLISKDWGWLDGGDGPLRWVSGYDKFQAHYGWYGNLFCSRPNVNSAITDLSYSFS